jgi:hypothetical protein
MAARAGSHQGTRVRSSETTGKRAAALRRSGGSRGSGDQRAYRCARLLTQWSSCSLEDAVLGKLGDRLKRHAQEARKIARRSCDVVVAHGVKSTSRCEHVERKAA